MKSRISHFRASVLNVMAAVTFVARAETCYVPCEPGYNDITIAVPGRFATESYRFGDATSGMATLGTVRGRSFRQDRGMAGHVRDDSTAIPCVAYAVEICFGPQHADSWFSDSRKP